VYIKLLLVLLKVALLVYLVFFVIFKGGFQLHIFGSSGRLTMNDSFRSTWKEIVVHFNIWKPEMRLNNNKKLCCMPKEIQ